MNAVYSIRTCCGDEVERIEIALPADCTDPADFAKEALSITGYDGYGCCGHCGDKRYRAYFAGYSVPPTPYAVVSVETVNRDWLIVTLETLLGYLRKMPEHVSSITCNDESGCIK